MTVLIENGQKNSINLYDKIKHFFQDDAREEIENDLNDDKYLLYPRHNFFDIDVKAKKRLVAKLKSNFYNNRNLIQDAIKFSDKKPPKLKNNNKNSVNILKEGVTIDDIDNFLKENNNKILLKKEIAKHILDQFDDIDELKYRELMDKINNTNNVQHIGILITLLIRSFCGCINVNNLIINEEILNEINEFTEMKKFL